MSELMINIGGGKYYRKHWRILDFPSKHYPYPSSDIDYIFDLTSDKSLPFKDNSVKFFFSSHTFEHIPQEHCQHIFNEIFRCLKKGGAIRITLPDFDKAYNAYRDRNIKFFVKYSGDNIEEKFLKFFGSYLKKKVPIEELKFFFEIMEKEEFADFYTNQIPRKSQIINGGNHINWWNFEKTKKLLLKAGFKNIYPSTPQKSKFSEMRGIEKRSGFDSTFPELSFFIEAIK